MKINFTPQGGTNQKIIDVRDSHLEIMDDHFNIFMDFDAEEPIDTSDEMLGWYDKKY